jgi:hypothetical protein
MHIKYSLQNLFEDKFGLALRIGPQIINYLKYFSSLNKFHHSIDFALQVINVQLINFHDILMIQEPNAPEFSPDLSFE